MITQHSQWTEKEFMAYLLLYAAHIDSRFSAEEKAHILSRIESSQFQKIFEAFEQDNDYHQLQKILMYQRQNHAFSAEKIISELKVLFLTDKHFHPMEKYMLSTIRQLLT